MKNKYTEENKESNLSEEEDLDLSMLMPLMMPGAMGGQRDSLEENGVIFLSGGVNEKSAEYVIRKLWAYHFDEDFTDSINLIINSPGGCADSMWALIDTMSAIKNDIHTIALGCIASAGVLIFMAGDNRTMSENCMAMIHHFSSGVVGNFPDLLAARKEQDLEYQRGIKHLIRNSKYKTEKQVRDHLLKDQNHWLSAVEMKDHGLVDSIFKNKKRKKK